MESRRPRRRSAHRVRKRGRLPNWPQEAEDMKTTASTTRETPITGAQTGEIAVPRDPALRTGAQILCEVLLRQNVQTIFGIPGGAIMPFYHALPEYADQLHHVLCR